MGRNGTDEVRGVLIADWSVNILAASGEFEKFYGRRADKRRKLSNGGMPCTPYQYFGEKRDG